ncbi:MAG: 2-phospho-L-lactate guanylyltransferase, partial [Bermanella sp.]
MNKLCIVIPMKSPSRSKQRLAGCLLDQERETLAVGLFTNTLG